MKKKVRCAIYTRKSTEEGLEQDFNSLDAQREACDAYIKSQVHEGWVLVDKQYNDGGYSGGTMERPAFKELLKDIENNEKNKLPLDLSVVSFAAQNLANIEDNLIFYGNEFLSVEGILNAKGTQKLKLSDWGAGENPYKDIVKAINMITEKGIVGKITLCLSRGLYFDLQRIQQGTGMTEAQRISSMIGNLFNVSVIKDKKASVICAEPQYIDLAIGIDMATAYLEQKDLNHSFRIMETVLPRIKEPNAIVVLE